MIYKFERKLKGANQVEATGEELTINNAGRKVKSFELSGKSSQKIRSGKNKLKITATTQTINGVEFIVNQDGTIIVNGTATEMAQIQLGKPMTGTYYYSGCPIRGRFYKFI